MGRRGTVVLYLRCHQDTCKETAVWQKVAERTTSLVDQSGKNLPAMQETGVRSLGRDEPLEKGMATHSSILAWEIPWTEEPGGLQSTGLQSWSLLSN